MANGSVNERGMYWVICRRFKGRDDTATTGVAYRDYCLGSSYYRDNDDGFDDIVLGGNVRVHFESNAEQIQIVVRRAYT